MQDTISNMTPITMPLRRLLAPVLLTGALVVWTAAVYRFSAYGDNWAIWPALVVLPLVVIWHGALVFKLRDHRKAAVVVSLAHLSILVPLWIACLMLISKDSL